MKQTIKIFFCVSALIFHCIPLAADDANSINLLGKSAEALGRGGTGISSEGVPFFRENPASIADTERFSGSINYGTLDGTFYAPGIDIAIPTAYGTLGLSGSYMDVSDSDNFSTGYAFSLGAARELTKKILLGMRADIFKGSGNEQGVYAGIGIGTIYRFHGMNKSKGFGLFSPKAGLAFDAGYCSNSSVLDLNRIIAGYSLNFYRGDSFTLGWYNEIRLLSYNEAFPVHLGLESVINDKYVLRAGGIIPVSGDYGYSRYTAGLGYRFSSQKISASIDYSLGYGPEHGLTHWAGLTVAWGELDREPPVTRVKSDRTYFSPNHDGINDYVLIHPEVEDKSRIASWKLQIKNPAGDLVKEYRTSEREITDDLTLKKFFRRIFSRKTSMVIPEKILWDGTDKNGAVQTDGTYAYTFYAVDERGNISPLKQGSLVLDTTSPEISLSADYLLFSPNKDGRKDKIIIKQKIRSEPEDKWLAKITDINGQTIRSFSWDAGEIPSSIEWDGTDENGKDMPEGLYHYQIECIDQAGNRASGAIREIALTRQLQQADITLSQPFFSHSKDKIIRIFPRLSDTKGLESWRCEILKNREKTVKEFHGEKDMPAYLEWNGTDNNGEKLSDGEYQVRLSSSFNSGNAPVSFMKTLIMDSTEPELAVEHSPEYFSPDNDGENDILSIKMSAVDNFEINKWELRIYSPDGTIFRQFSGQGTPPEELKWDGLSGKGEIVESAADYEIELTASDFAGNRGISRKDRLRVDILVLVTERGLKMRISNIEFAFDSARLRPRGKKILDRVVEILEKYARYDVVIEGHTDNIGTDEHNLVLSEHRAQAVLEYLANEGIEKTRLEPVGMGESMPVRDNSTEEGRRRNRRVEFLLIKRDNPQ